MASTTRTSFSSSYCLYTILSTNFSDEPQIIFFLSYSGLGPDYEPNFTDEQLRANFALVKAAGFPLVHYWRPLLPKNTTSEAIWKMLSFVSVIADATVFTGLKLHPELTEAINRGKVIRIPVSMRDQAGEWLMEETVIHIYREASRICPTYKLYRHTSCALACIRHQPNHTATVFRGDICPSSHCPDEQRGVCRNACRIPTLEEISAALRVLGKNVRFVRTPECVVIKTRVSQEQYAFLLHQLKCPLKFDGVHMQNIYHGDIFKGQTKLA